MYSIDMKWFNALSKHTHTRVDTIYFGVAYSPRIFLQDFSSTYFAFSISLKDYPFSIFGAGCKQVHCNCNPEFFLWWYINRQSPDNIDVFYAVHLPVYFLLNFKNHGIVIHMIKIRRHLNVVGKTQNQEFLEIKVV